MKRQKVIKIIIIILLIWGGIFTTDWVAVTSFEHSPIFCLKSNKYDDYYIGCGYTYDIGIHPITGEFQYGLSFFGINTKSTFTN